MLAQKDQQGSAALAHSRVHQWATSHPAAAAVPFFCPVVGGAEGAT